MTQPPKYDSSGKTFHFGGISAVKQKNISCKPEEWCLQPNAYAENKRLLTARKTEQNLMIPLNGRYTCRRGFQTFFWITELKKMNQYISTRSENIATKT